MTQRVNPSLQFVFSCTLTNGLHARPASHLAETVDQFASECTLTNLRNGLAANGKSVLSVIAADIRYGDECAVHVSGADEQSAYAALRQFIEETLPECDVPLAVSTAPIRNDTPPRLLEAAGVSCSFGLPVSRGIARGKVVIVRRMTLPATLTTPGKTDPQRELNRIKGALASVRHRLGEKLKSSLNPTGAAILQADLAMANDVSLAEKLAEQILLGKSAGQAVVETGEFFIDLLGHSENEYIRERSADIEEICLQLLEEIYGTSPQSAAVELCEPSVVVAETLAPQQLLELDRRYLKALVLEHSGSTSHAAILARSLGIPTLAGVRNARLALSPGQEVVVDADRGFVVAAASPAVRKFYEREERILERRKQSSRHAGKNPVTSDGKALEVAANASSVEEVAIALENGADGVGLFRTEMIFLGRKEAPSEEEQFAIYAEAARRAGGRPVIVRTLDVGGDKNLPYLNLPQEPNPFLGYRGARIYAEHSQLLQSQLRAVLRASAVGNLQIMAPMISSLEEILEFKRAINQAKQDLAQIGAGFRPDIKIGMMVEVPSVAFILDELSAEVDFFSIGTNDLCQYFFAADRTSARINGLLSVRHPGFLRFLKRLVEQVHRAGKWVGMCGEMAADIQNLPLLLGLGLDEISVPAAEVRDFKETISRVSAAECRAILDQAVASQGTREVENLLRSRSPHPAPALLSEDLVLLGSPSHSKEEVMQEMIDAIYVASRTKDRDLLEEALWAREAVYSTGLGYGFATPHCKTDAVTADSICVLKLNEPINWDSVDGERVRMVVLLALRNSEIGNSHMQVFSTLARKLMDEEFRQHLLEVQSAGEVTAYLSQQLGIPNLQ